MAQIDDTGGKRGGEPEGGATGKSGKRAEGRKGRGAGRALVFGVVAVGVGVAAGFLMLQLADRGSVTPNLSANEFDAGPADRIARDIASGVPILYPSLRGSNRDVFVQHLGEDTRRGWLAFDARWPDTPRECNLIWNRLAQRFDPPDPTDRPACAGIASANPDGTAILLEGAGSGEAETRLPQYNIRVTAEGKVVLSFSGQASE